MQKGKFGFQTWLYPFIALWTVLVGPAWAPIAILGFVLVMENDPWAGRQCFRVILFDIYWLFYQTIVDMITSIPLIGTVLAVPLGIIDFIVYIVLLILILVLGLGRLKQGRDVAVPGGKIADMAYGLIREVRQQPQYQPEQNQYQQNQYQQQYQPPQNPQTPPSQPTTGGFTPPPPPPPVPGGTDLK